MHQHLNHIPEPALEQELCTVPGDRDGCLASPHSNVHLLLVLVGDIVPNTPGQAP